MSCLINVERVLVRLLDFIWIWSSVVEFYSWLGKLLENKFLVNESMIKLGRVVKYVGIGLDSWFEFMLIFCIVL